MYTDLSPILEMAYMALLALGDDCALPYALMCYEVLPYLDRTNIYENRILVYNQLMQIISHCSSCIPEYVGSIYFQQSYFKRYKTDLYTSPVVTEQMKSYKVDLGNREYYPDFSGLRDIINRKELIAANIKPKFLSQLATVNYQPSMCRQYIGDCFQSLLDQGENIICVHYLTLDMRDWLIERTLVYADADLENLWKPLAKVITLKRGELNKHYNTLDPDEDQVRAGAQLVTAYAYQLLEQMPLPLSLQFMLTRRIYDHFICDG